MRSSFLEGPNTTPQYVDLIVLQNYFSVPGRTMPLRLMHGVSAPLSPSSSPLCACKLTKTRAMEVSPLADCPNRTLGLNRALRRVHLHRPRRHLLSPREQVHVRQVVGHVRASLMEHEVRSVLHGAFSRLEVHPTRIHGRYVVIIVLSCLALTLNCTHARISLS